MTGSNISIRNKERAEELTSRLQSAVRDHYFEWTSDQYHLYYDKTPHALQNFASYAEAEAFVEGVWFGKDRT